MRKADCHVHQSGAHHEHAVANVPCCLDGADDLRWVLELVFAPQLVADTTAWGLSAGWQREIGFWNFGMLLMITTVLRREMDWITARRAALVLCILNALFGTNHLAAFMSSGEAWGNGIGVLVNYGCLLLGAAALWNDRASKTP